MKVVVLSSLAYSLLNFRGRLLQAMVDAGHEVIACAPDPNPKVEADLKAMGIRFAVIRMARTGSNPFDDLVTLRDMVALLRRERPDVVLAYTQKPIIYGGIAARIVGGMRYYAMCSGLGHVYSGEAKGKLAVLRKIVSVLYRAAVAKADGVFVFNRDDEAEMRRHGILKRGEKADQVPGSGIDLTRFEHKAVREGAPVFLMVARLMRDKGPGEFAEAARIVKRDYPDAQFRLLGPFDANPSGITEAELQQWQDDGLIDYLGSTEDVRPYLADCSVFVLPTYYREGLPRTILEAMATGRAIITTDTPGCRETVLKGENGYLVEPRDAASLADAMRNFCEDPGLAARCGAKSREIAETRFDVEIVNAMLLELTGLDRSLVDRNPPRASRNFSAYAATRPSGLRRVVDFAVALAGIALLWPPMLLIAAAIRVRIGSPVLFRQQRAGLAGKPFELVKFRTMDNASDASGKLLPDEERTPPLGAFLRRFRLDELPELWNVLKGDMSLIGPRPLLPHTVDDFGLEGITRSRVRPGLTGLAQVKGGPLLRPADKLAFDNWYVHNRSLRLDCDILVKTLVVAVRDDRVDLSGMDKMASTLDRQGV
ncbi:sugar transferase [Aurantiacibacter poecillastricola]|uniref:sugar transferase n=1 Tax=Aurantiacibacter poecillastricola TaxID=3064385 RepID=UPI00273F57A7|nr:sugar transferase [Aurantiacibacter sp. 219JJ12-13]MDP5259999.1 sugar transferase [Aurantiacibacter sp. 219JJ12-13]